MGIALSTLNDVFAPLQRLVYWLAGHSVDVVGASPAARAIQPRANLRAASAVRPLHVVRVFEPSHAPASAGRMVISGRMADVCAELDRLCALERAH